MLETTSAKAQQKADNSYYKQGISASAFPHQQTSSFNLLLPGPHRNRNYLSIASRP
jgi:hypothetical protein